MTEKTARSLSRDAMAYVLAGGRGSRLKELTDRRAKPAVYFGGKTRIIDFALSNALNSGIRKMAIATQYKAHSLIRHCQRGWNFFRAERNEYLDILPASQRVHETKWYLGTADAVAQNIDIIDDYKVEFVIILAGDHIYKMDYASLIADHVALGKKCTVACIEVPIAEASAFGVMAIDDQRRIVDFVEKPEHPPAMPGKPEVSLASMGIYVFDAKALFAALEKDAATPGSSRDFGKDVIPAMVAAGQAVAHPFGLSCVKSTPEAPAYWRDVGTVEAYWAANLDLTNTIPELDMYDRDWPIWTYQEQLPPAKFVFDDDGRRGCAVDSLVSGGCIISGALVRRSVLFSKVRIHSFATVEESVILPEVDIGRSCELRKVVIDNGCVIPDGMKIGVDAADDARRFFRTDNGVVLVTRAMLEKLE